MNHGPLIFLGLFAALAASWFGMIVQPQLQLGRAVPGTNIVDNAVRYPQARPGLAQRGLAVYRSLGCATCHTRQVRQDGMVLDVILRETGTNATEVLEAMARLRRDLTREAVQLLTNQLPAVIQHGLDQPEAAGAAVKALTDAGAKAQLQLRAQGPDIARGWGRGRTVAADFLYDDPALPGNIRLGPDLANVGARLPSPQWHYLHLYDPRSATPKSVMPPYRFLFERRRAGNEPSPDALALGSAQVGGAGGGEEIVPSDDARALVAFLLSLRSDVPLLERPVTTGDAPATAAAEPPPDTSTPAAGAPSP